MAAIFIIFFTYKNPCSTQENKQIITIAFLDTGICPEKILLKNTMVQSIESQVDLTDSVKFDCQNLHQNESKLNPRYHGHFVLQEFIEFINPSIPIKIYPFIIFNNNGSQNKLYWEKAIDWIKTNKPQFVLTAAGLLTNDKLQQYLPSIWFVPAGRNERGIGPNTNLFPQMLAPQKNIFIIGDYLDGETPLYDHNLKYQNQIDYYFPSGKKLLNGTSRAVAEALGRAINFYYYKCNSILPDFRGCINQNSKTLFDQISKKKFKTY